MKHLLVGLLSVAMVITLSNSAAALDLMIASDTLLEPQNPPGDGIYADAELGYSVVIPEGWNTAINAMPRRYEGYDALGIYKENGAYHSEAMILVGLEGVDYDNTTSLEEYLERIIYHKYYEKISTEISEKSRYIYWKDDLGDLFFTFKGSNVFSLFFYDGLVDDIFKTKVLDSFALEDRQITISETKDILRFEGINRDVSIVSDQIIQRTANELVPITMSISSLPAMKLPWDAANRSFTGGPHTGYGSGCSNIQSISTVAGLDFDLNSEEVLAVAVGTVEYHRNSSGGIGNEVGIDHDGGLRTRYWHLASFDDGIHDEDNIAQGTVLGISGGTPTHLHIEFSDASDGKYSADGVVIDGYTVKSITRLSDGSAYSYDGTMIKGTPSSEDINYCDSIPDGEGGYLNDSKKWSGSDATVEASDTSAHPVTSTNVRVEGADTCSPPDDQDWVVTTSCEYTGSYSTNYDVIVENNALLTIMPSAQLNINFQSHKLFVESGSGVLVKSGGKIY